MNSLKSVDFTLADDPFALFAEWFVEAQEREINDPEAMTLATVDAEGMPDASMMLCKHVGRRGLIFYTNVESAKGEELAVTPKAAALFHWKSLRRQARFRGPVAALDAAAVDAYYHSRPRVSQLGAWASQQSRPLGVARGAGGAGRIVRPAIRRWRNSPARLLARLPLTPVEIEFWSDGAFRLHDRVRFTREGDGWRRQRLFP